VIYTSQECVKIDKKRKGSHPFPNAYSFYIIIEGC